MKSSSESGVGALALTPLDALETCRTLARLQSEGRDRSLARAVSHSGLQLLETGGGKPNNY